MTKSDIHATICKNLNIIYEKKNKDYNDSFGKMYHELGIITAVTRIGDKFNRLKSLSTKSEAERMVKDETIKDTFMDLANYCIMSLIEEEWGELENEEKNYI